MILQMYCKLSTILVWRLFIKITKGYNAYSIKNCIEYLFTTIHILYTMHQHTNFNDSEIQLKSLTLNEKHVLQRHC